MPTTQEVLAQSTAAAQKAAQMIGGNFTQGVGFSPNVPTNAGQVTPTPAPQMPVVKTTTGNTSNASAVTAGADVNYASQLKLIQEQQAARAAEASAQNQQQQSVFSQLLGNRKDSSTVRAEQEQVFGIDTKAYIADKQAKVKEIQTLQDEYTKAKENLDTQVAALEGQGRGIPLDLLNNQAAQMQRNAAPKLNRLSAEINTRSAVLQAIEGNFQEAQGLINQAVKDYTADTADRLNMFQAYSSVNQAAFERLDSIYQDSFKQSMALAQQQHEENVARVNSLADIQLKYPGFKVDFSKSLQDNLSSLQRSGLAVAAGGGQATAFLSGIVGWDDLTPTEKGKVAEDLAKKGYGSSVPPQWFTTQLQTQSRQSLMPSVVQTAWDKERARMKASQTTQSKVTDVELKQFVRQQMITPEFQALSKTDKRNYILSTGADPDDFNL